MEEIAALNLYTKANVAWPDRSFYAVLNRILNDKDRRKIVPFFHYLKLFSPPSKNWRTPARGGSGCGEPSPTAATTGRTSTQKG